MLRTTTLLLALLSPQLAFADDDPPPPPTPEPPPPSPVRGLSFLVRTGFESGGDTVVTVQDEQGEPRDFLAGRGFSGALGLIYFDRDRPYSIEATIGLKRDRGEYVNGDVEVRAFPLDVIASLASPDGPRIGLGVTMHLAPKFSCNLAGSCLGGVEADTAFGVMLQAALALRPGSATGVDLAVRYTHIGYEVDDVALDGSSLGVFLGARL